MRRRRRGWPRASSQRWRARLEEEEARLEAGPNERFPPLFAMLDTVSRQVCYARRDSFPGQSGES